jgi:hypothetical protein
VFLVATSVLNHPKQVIYGSKIDVQSYESWLANKKVNSFIINLLRLSHEYLKKINEKLDFRARRFIKLYAAINNPHDKGSSLKCPSVNF